MLYSRKCQITVTDTDQDLLYGGHNLENSELRTFNQDAVLTQFNVDPRLYSSEVRIYVTVTVKFEIDLGMSEYYV